MANCSTYRDTKHQRCIGQDTPEEKAAKRAAWFALPRKPRTVKPKPGKPKREPRPVMVRATSVVEVLAIPVDPKYEARANDSDHRGNCHGFVRRCQMFKVVDNDAVCSKYDKKLNWNSVFPAGVRRCKECKCKGVW